MIKEIIVKKIYTDDEISKKEGEWFDEDCLKLPVIDKDIDVYYYENNRKKLLLKFRKQQINLKNCEIGWKNYKDLAKASRGRGASAGPINPNSVYWKKRNLRNTNKWSTQWQQPIPTLMTTQNHDEYGNGLNFSNVDSHEPAKSVYIVVELPY